MKDNNNFIKSLTANLFKIISGLIILCMLVAVLLIRFSPSFRSRRYPREKACYSNMRVLLGAVEMYNMDNEDGINKFDSQTMPRLLKGKYLLKPLQKPEKACEYYSDKEFSDGGVINCRLHGTLEGPPLPPPTPSIIDNIVRFIRQ